MWESVGAGGDRFVLYTSVSTGGHSFAVELAEKQETIKGRTRPRPIDTENATHSPLHLV